MLMPDKFRVEEQLSNNTLKNMSYEEKKAGYRLVTETLNNRTKEQLMALVLSYRRLWLLELKTYEPDIDGNETITIPDYIRIDNVNIR